MTKINLANPTPESLRDCVVAVTGLACCDHRAGKVQYCDETDAVDRAILTQYAPVDFIPVDITVENQK